MIKGFDRGVALTVGVTGALFVLAWYLGYTQGLWSGLNAECFTTTLNNYTYFNVTL